MNALLVSAVLALGQWGPAGCPPVGGSGHRLEAATAYEWREAGPGWQYLYRRGRLIGAWDGTRYATRCYDGWQDAPPPWQATPEVDEPADAEPLPMPAGKDQSVLIGQEPVTENHGVNLDRLGGSARKRWQINGRDVSREMAVQYLTEGLPDDSTWLRVTVIGPESDRQRVVEDLRAHPAYADFRGRLLVQGYDAADPMIAGIGAVRDGRPTVYVQAPSGKVLHRQDDYAGGPEKLAGAIRKADPNYKPARDPDLSKSTNPLDWLHKIDLSKLKPEYIGLALLAAFAAVMKLRGMK